MRRQGSQGGSTWVSAPNRLRSAAPWPRREPSRLSSAAPRTTVDPWITRHRHKRTLARSESRSRSSTVPILVLFGDGS